MSLTVWFGFLLAAILIAVTPGPGAVISMSTGMRHGYRAALTAAETAFTLLRLIGAGYLVGLGTQKWRAPPLASSDGVCPKPRRNGLFTQGLPVNLTNPKAIIFICALVPQFVDPARA